MAKIIIITREKLEESHLKLKKLLAEDPHWKEELKQIEYYETQVKKRHDAEYADMTCPQITDPVVELGSNMGEGSNASKTLYPGTNHQ